ncbi:hypothetical protein OPT61_g2632 [Boeremia exigua]|uniref:Uncharacterized protein n=1 Tax=Boeremia exigua TaxID=749465 RepID=A0ACC2IL11_9PLEO|nr:hypothetical protein OPT61_g2632 [Boeremia exigua]
MYITDTRGRKKTPLKHSLLFNKAKHSEDWHQAIDDTAGVLHPSDQKFPYPLLRQATDVYLKKKGKITQADVDLRLAILVDSHAAKDIAVAAVAHAMTAGNLRRALHIDLNVAYGSYWGLEAWLQCLIAAHYNNPASVTDLEAIWARHLLPFATHGSGAAGKILIGISRALRECATPNMNMVPDFLNLTSRAVTDFGAYLEGLRLKNKWIAAYGASYWLSELGRTSPASTPPGYLLPEHIFDAQFPIWRVWASWKPDLGVLQILDSIDGSSAAIISDLLALEGPDFIDGTKATLRESLIGQYGSDRNFVKFERLVVQVPGRTKGGLREVLESAVSTLISIWSTAAPAYRPHLLNLFAEVVIARPMTQEALNIVQAVLFMSAGAKSGIGPDITDALLRVYTQRDELGGSHIQDLQDLVQLCDQNHASSLRRLLFTPTLLRGIARCIQDGQAAIRTIIENGQPWTELALELHTFCVVIKQSKSVSVVEERTIGKTCLLLPSTEQMVLAIDISSAARDWRMSGSHRVPDTDMSVENDKHTKDSRQLSTIPVPFTGQTKSRPHPLEEVVEQFISHRLLMEQAPNHISQCIFQSTLRIWECSYEPELTRARRALATSVVGVVDNDTDVLLRCLDGIVSINDQLGLGFSVQDLLNIMKGMERSPEHSLVQLIRLLASCPGARDLTAQTLCWRDLAYHLLAQEAHSGGFKDIDLLGYALSTMNASQWLSFLADVQLVFVSGPPLPPDDDAIPPVLRPEIHEYWAELLPYAKTLTRLEEALGDNSGVVRCILSCSGARSSSTIAILQALKIAEQETVEPFLQKIAGMLSVKAANKLEVLGCVTTILDAHPKTIEVCKKIWDAKHGFLMIPALPDRCRPPVPSTNQRLKAASISTCSSTKASAVALVSTVVPLNAAASRYNVPSSVVEVMIAGWLVDENASEDTRIAVRSIASLLNLEPTGSSISKDKLLEAGDFWQKIENELIQEASRLEALQKALKKTDPQGTSLLLQQIGVPDTIELDEEISNLPAEVLDLVERIGDKEVEITFPLAAFTQLQRGAMGVPDSADTLLLQLFLDYSKELPVAFCLHYNSDQTIETVKHTRYSCSPGSENPTKQICTSSQTALTWQLGRIIYSKLQRGETGILDIYQYVKASLPELSQYCATCSTTHESQSARLRRSTPCDLTLHTCARLWYSLPLHVRIPEIRTDFFAVDIALSSVYTAAMTNKPELLPNCPIRGLDLIRTIMNSLPTMHVMRDAVDLSSILKSYHPQAEKLISWAVVHHRGFLATATGLLKIPNLPPGTHQFVLANASPKRENAFAQKIRATKRETTVLFHGTSLDRLPAILAQGLRVCSGTPLQRTGAAHGKGIYLCEEPATSFYYSTASLSWKNSGLNNMRMLFGCELVGSANKVTGNIHIVTDVESVMVRYILLFTKDARIPIRGHVEPAMASGMKALRSGAV